MGHGIIKGLDHVGSTRGGEWHTFGELIERGLSAEEAGKRKNLFWGVDGYPLVAESAEAQKTLEQLAKAIERDDMIAAAFRINHEEVGVIPLHQQSLSWGVSKKVKIVQRADNQILFYWATME